MLKWEIPVKSDIKWIEAVINHEKTGSVPYNFMFTPPIEQALLDYFQTNDLENTLHLPTRHQEPMSIKPQYANPSIYGDSVADEFSVVWSTNKIDRGSPIGICLESPTLKGYQFPNAQLPERFEHLQAWCKRQADHFRVIWVGDLWERATFMRGTENLLMDVVLNRSFVRDLLNGITEYMLETMEILAERFDFECVALSDDYGTQRGLLISPDHWRELVKPCLTKVYAAAKAANKRIWHHSCGHIVPIIPDLIDIGLDILHPIQPEAMDIYELKKRFGANVTFSGGMPTQKLLPKGTPEQIRAEVKKIITRMSKGGGFIFEPGITIQADIPLENVLAMIDQASKYPA